MQRVVFCGSAEEAKLSSHASIRPTSLYLLIGLILLLDQSLKIWVKTNMYYGEELDIFGVSWINLVFVENPGMAFGIAPGGAWGKPLLSLLRIVAVAFLWYYLQHLLERQAPKGLLISFVLILTGAMGNIIDSAVYGLIFTESVPHTGIVAQLVTPGHGYAGFLYGQVVDMFHLSIAEGIYPSWIPFIGGHPFKFFRPIFNLADVSICLGVAYVLFFHWQFFASDEDDPKEISPPDELNEESPHSPL